LSHGAWVEAPFTAIATSFGDFPSISCQGKTCVLVEGGSAAVNSGSGWTATTLPEPTGDTSGVNLDSVSCISAQRCVAVGSPSGFGGGPVIETYSAGTWTAEAPLPSGAFGNLQSVDCASVSSCVAVGSGNSSSANGIQSWVETLAGASWSATFLPPASGATYGELRGISCSTSTSCTAVGSWFPGFGGDGDPLVATLSSGTWHESTVAPSGGAEFANLNSVGCIANGACDAVEVIVSGSGDSSIVLELGGPQIDLPLPPGATSVTPQSITCDRAGWCDLAGFYNAPFGTSPGTASYPMFASSGAPTISFSSAAKATAVVGKPFTFDVVTTSKPGGAIAADGLPAGFTLTDSGNDMATISGTATSGEVGVTEVILNAENGVAPPASQTLKLKIKS
jgi:hypothetical protein